MRLTKESLEKDPDLDGAYKVKLPSSGTFIDLRLDPDDVLLEEVMGLANKVLAHFESYEQKARDIIARDFLDEYNNRRFEDDLLPAITEQEFTVRLQLKGINLLSRDCIDFFYSADGMFGNHSLIAQSFDGMHFSEAIIFG